MVLWTPTHPSTAHPFLPRPLKQDLENSPVIRTELKGELEAPKKEPFTVFTASQASQGWPQTV